MAIPVKWHPKDPDEEIIYELVWGDSLLAGDVVVDSEWSDIVGVVNEEASIAPDGLSTRIRLSGGVDGDTATLTNTVTTQSGEVREQIVLLPIIANTLAPLGPYDVPRPDDLTTRYPAFRDVPYDTIAIHINDALSGADTSWAERDYQPAVLALAAHTMALLGLGDEGEIQNYRRQGVVSVRDGAFGVTFNEKCVGRSSGGGFDATQYGRIYKTLLRRNRAGPRVAGGGLSGDLGWGPLAQQNNGVILP
jgi:hypothetical protein